MAKRGNGSGAGTDHAVMRELNRSLVLDVLKRAGVPISRAAIAKETQLAKATVSAIVDDLLAEGFATEVGVGRTTSEGGRPPMLLALNGRAQFFAGVHVGVVHTTVVVTDATGLELAERRRPTPADPATALDTIADEITAAMTSVKAARRRLAAVGVCVPGLVDLDAGVCRLAPNLGWRDVPVRQALADALGCEVYVHNTAQACAVAETLQGAAKGADAVVLLYAGTGVGCGIVVDGRLYPGATGISGEIGHVRVPGADRVCSCGKVGCLETVVSGPAIRRQAAAAGFGDDSTTFEQIVDAATTGDATARRLVEQAGRQLGLAASWLVNVLNPEVLVIGGGLAQAGELVLGPLRAAVAESSLPHATEHLAIRAWSLGQEAKVRGAVLVAQQRSERSVRVIFGAAGQ